MLVSLVRYRCQKKVEGGEGRWRFRARWGSLVWVRNRYGNSQNRGQNEDNSSLLSVFSSREDQFVDDVDQMSSKTGVLPAFMLHLVIPRWSHLTLQLESRSFLAILLHKRSEIEKLLNEIMRTSFPRSFPPSPLSLQTEYVSHSQRRRLNFPIFSAFLGWQIYGSNLLWQHSKGSFCNCCRCPHCLRPKPNNPVKSLKKLIIPNLAITSSSSIQLSSKALDREQRWKAQKAILIMNVLWRFAPHPGENPFLRSSPSCRGISIPTSRHLPWAERTIPTRKHQKKLNVYLPASSRREREKVLTKKGKKAPGNVCGR